LQPAQFDTGFCADSTCGSTNIALVAAMLPESRSVEVGATATAFATMINAGTALGCTIAPQTVIPATFLFQTTNPNTNTLTGTPNTPADIAQGAAQSFVIALTPTAAFAPTDIVFTFSCANASPVATLTGINTLNLSGSTTRSPTSLRWRRAATPALSISRARPGRVISRSRRSISASRRKSPPKSPPAPTPAPPICLSASRCARPTRQAARALPPRPAL
jgi:hypothetical protein